MNVPYNKETKKLRCAFDNRNPPLSELHQFVQTVQKYPYGSKY